jgi:uncharacterized protein YeaO (DUF488 family)
VIHAPRIGIGRVYDELPRSAEARLLVDRVWPRGVARQKLLLDEWIPEVAPSTTLRTWFGHDPSRWDEFQRRYRAELDRNPQAVARCMSWCEKGPVLLLYGAKDRDHNQAIVLRDYLYRRLEAK